MKIEIEQIRNGVIVRIEGAVVTHEDTYFKMEEAAHAYIKEALDEDLGGGC